MAARDDDLTPAEFARLRSLPPQDAVETLQERGRVEQTWSWQDAWQAEHNQMFTISRLARADLLQAIREGLEKSVSGELSRRDWMRDTEKLLRDAGWWGTKTIIDPDTGEEVSTTFDAARLALIFDTNTRQAYAAGQWERIQKSKRFMPYLRYVTKRDDRVRPAHRAWDNVTLPVDDPFWQTHFPPNGWRCRCAVVQVSEGEYQRGRTPGGTMKKDRPDIVNKEFINRRTGEVMDVPAGIDPGFSYNPGAARRAERSGAVDSKVIDDKLQALSPDIAAAARLDGLTPPPPAVRSALAGAVPGSATRASAWTHPKTGQTRIYLNALPGQGSAKVWIEALDQPDAFGYDYDIRRSGSNLTRGEAGNLVNAAESWLEQLAGRRVKRFAELLVLLGG